MKRFLSLLFAVFAVLSCATQKYVEPGQDAVMRKYIKSPEMRETVVSQERPDIYEYYTQGLLAINGVRETTYADGTKRYDVRYTSKKRYITDPWMQMDVLNTFFPEIYRLCVEGKAHVVSMYVFMDKKTNKPAYNIHWRTHIIRGWIY
jgi:hypothetical protein